jgi:thiamine monophosphate synthase
MCIKSGAYGVAVIGAVMKSSNITETIIEFKEALGEL